MLTWPDVISLAAKGNADPGRRVERPDVEWRALLTPDEYRVTRLKGTERPFSSPMCSRLEPGRYAVFAYRGRLHKLGLAYQYIYGAWFPASGHGARQAAHFERHAPDYPGDRDDAETQIWIPVEGPA